MRATKSSYAVERLNKRVPGHHYSMVRGADNLFHLVEVDQAGRHTRVCEPMEQDDFVRFVNSLGPQKVERVSKFDQAMDAQIKRSRSRGDD